MINFLNYKSYRIPFIDEFKPGLIYYYIDTSFRTYLKCAYPSKCKAQIGLMILEARILQGNKDGTVHLMITEPIPNISYFNNTLKYSKISLENFPIKYLYDYEGFEKPFTNFCSSIERNIRKGIWGTLWGIQKLEYIKEAIIQKKIWVNGNIIRKSNLSLNGTSHPWIVVTCPDNTVKFNGKFQGEIKSINLPSESPFIFTKEPSHCVLFYKSGAVICNYIEEVYRFQYLKPYRYVLYYPVKGYYLTKEIKNLEELNPMKSLYKEIMEDNQLIQQIKRFAGKTKARKQLRYLKPELTKTQVKEIIDNIWQEKQDLVIKKMNIHNLMLTKLPIKHYQFSFAQGGKVNSDGTINFEITDTISGISLNAAFRRLKKKYHIRKEWVFRIYEITNCVNENPNRTLIFEKKFKSKNKTKDKPKKINKSNHILNENRLVCIRHIEKERKILRLPRSEAKKLIDEDMYVFTSKARYKRLKGKSKKITNPKVIKVLPSQCICKTGKNLLVKTPITYTKPAGKIIYQDDIDKLGKPIYKIEWFYTEHKGFAYKRPKEVKDAIIFAKRGEKTLANRVAIVEPYTSWTEENEFIKPPDPKPMKQDTKMLHKRQKQDRKFYIVSAEKRRLKRLKAGRFKKRYFNSHLKRRRIVNNIGTIRKLRDNSTSENKE